jgi:Big-like domain-containing protein
VIGSITLSASASDDAAVVGVQLKLDGVALGPEDTQAPYELTWNTAGATNGAHVLTAIARDAAGHSSTSAPVSVRVSNDSAAPAVSLASPGANVAGSVTIAASASDDVGVAGIQFSVDGVPVGAEATSAPYAITWDSTTAPNGVHVLTAVARDTAGNSTPADAVTVTVSNDAAAPIIAVTAPNGTVSGALTLAAAASDDIAVTGVQFLVDGVALSAPDTTAPYELTWDTAAASNGRHTLTAVAQDAAGHATTAEPVSVAVLNDTAPPTVAVTTESSTFVGSVTIAALASDDVGVVAVQFLVDGEPLGAADTAPGYDVAWDTTTAPNGVHSLTAIARDAAGRSTTAATVSVTVANSVGLIY